MIQLLYSHSNQIFKLLIILIYHTPEMLSCTAFMRLHKHLMFALFITTQMFYQTQRKKERNPRKQN